MTSALPPTASAKPSGPTDGIAGDKAPSRAGAHGVATSAEPASLKLVIGKSGVGIELASPAALGPLRVRDLAVVMGGLSFPLDVSGGVARFRHRRGSLQRIALEADARALASFLAERTQNLLGVGNCDAWVAARADGSAMVCLAEAQKSGGLRRDGLSSRSNPVTHAIEGAVLAFDVRVTGGGDALHVVVEKARGFRLPGAPTALAHKAVANALGPIAERRGCEFILRDVATLVGKRVFPDVGVRAPSAGDMVFTAIGAQGETFSFRGEHKGTPASIGEQALRSRELAAIVREGDDARFAGNTDEARDHDLRAWERAPRHPEVARRIAEVDAVATERAEAALALLDEAIDTDDPSFDFLRAELYEQQGDTARAAELYALAGSREEAPWLAACAFERAARLTIDDTTALDFFDRAVALAPRTLRLYWERIPRRLSAGRFVEALADTQQLEAQTASPREKHDVLVHAAFLWRSSGALEGAITLYERALRYVPNDAVVIARLGEAMAETGRSARGASLLKRAIDLAASTYVEGESASYDWMRIALAKALGDGLGDRSAAIARLGEISATANEKLHAWGLEARYRAALGETASASATYQKLREACLVRTPVSKDALYTDIGDTDRTLADLLVEAAIFERKERGDALAERAHLEAALKRNPHHDVALLRLNRANTVPRAADASTTQPVIVVTEPIPPMEPSSTGQSASVSLGTPDAPVVPRTRIATDHDLVPRESDLSGLASDEAMAPSTSDLPMDFDSHPSNAPSKAMAIDFGLNDTGDDAADIAVAEARIEELTRLVQADPTNDLAGDELAALLARLGKVHEFLALQLARFEDAAPERREKLRGPCRHALGDLENVTREKGTAMDLQLLQDARQMLGVE